MTLLMLQSLSPLLIIAFGTVLSLLLIAWRRSQKMILAFTIAIFVCAILASISLVINLTDGIQVTSLMKIDRYGCITLILILIASISVSILSSAWLTHSVEMHDEFFILLQLSSNFSTSQKI